MQVVVSSSTCLEVAKHQHPLRVNFPIYGAHALLYKLKDAATSILLLGWKHNAVYVA